MTKKQIMKLVDALSEASFEQGLNRLRDFPEQSREAVVAAIDALTKDSERYLFLRDDFAVNSSDDRFEFAELAQFRGDDFDCKVTQEMEKYYASKPSKPTGTTHN